jgi:RHS repeat-associated protein
VTDLGTSTVLADFRFVYDGWNMVGEMNSSLSLQRSYLWGLDLSGSEQGAGGVSGLIAVRQHSDSTSHFAAFDGNGDVGGLVGVSDGTTTGDGAITAVYEYGPFGEPLRTTGDYAKNNPFRFSTKFTDNESGLVYYGYRYYNQSTGRWLSRDPVEEQGFKTTFVNKKSTVLDQVNLFFFVGNVPLSAIDADGLIANWIAGCGVGCVVGGIGGAIGGIGGGIKSIKCGALGGAVSGCCLGIVGQTPLAPWASCACGLIGGVVEQMCSGSVTDPCAIASIVASTAMGCLGPATDMLGGKHKIVEAITGVIIGAGGPVCSGIKGL